ncbi:MAG: thiol peroxidase [Myxococcota bacterium]
MEERKGVITFKGNPLTLLGSEIGVGDSAPNFTALDKSLNSINLTNFRGKTVVISSVPSLDTPVCDAQTRRFNQEAEKLGKEVVVLTVSMDLPFAQARWCGAAGVERVVTLSDHRDASFGMLFGMLIKELRLLARGVYVVDKNGDVTYRQIVKEVTSEPNYEEVLVAVKQLIA